MQIQKNQKDAYEKELELLKDKQRDIYNDFICDYNTKREELEINYNIKIENANKKHNDEKQEINEKSLKNEDKMVNKKILLLEDKMQKLTKMKLFKEAEKIKIELENEKKLLKNKKKVEKIKTNKIEINNLSNKQNKRINKITLDYNKQKSELEIQFNKEKNELFNKFKNQLNDFKMFKNKNIKKKMSHNYANSVDNILNKSFNKEKLDKKLEDEEESI